MKNFFRPFKLLTKSDWGFAHFKVSTIALCIIFINNSSISASSLKKIIRIGTTSSLPPYLYKETFTGVEIDIITAAFKEQGFDTFEHVDSSFKRSIKLLAENDIDAITSNAVNKYYENFKNIYSSTPVLNYIDCAITLRKKNIQINNFSDLKDKRVWAFKSAEESLGKEYVNAIRYTSEYNQHISQSLQPKALFLERFDIAISDINIFMTQAIKENIEKMNFKAFQILPPTPRVLRFNNIKLRDSFNFGLNKIKANGKYKEILLKYHKFYTSKCE